MWPFRRKTRREEPFAEQRPARRFAQEVPDPFSSADRPPGLQAQAAPPRTAADVLRELEGGAPAQHRAGAPVDPTLGRFLLGEGPVTREYIHKQLAVGALADSYIGQALTRLDAPSEAELFALLAAAYRVPELDLKKCRVHVSAARSIPREVALKYKAIPIQRVGDLLCVVFAGEPNPKAIEAIRRATGLPLKAFRCPEHHIRILLRRLYPPASAATLAVPISKQEYHRAARGGASQAVARWERRHTTQGPVRAIRLARR